MAIYELDGQAPVVPASAYVAPEATLIGKVTLGEGSSVWPSAVIRADNEPVQIGAGVNIQDGAVLHTDPGCPMVLEDHVSIGHLAMLHGCTVGAGSLIGIGAVVLNKAVIGKHCLVGAGAVVTEGKVFPDRSLILGAPAKVARPLTDEQVAQLIANAQDYVTRQAFYKQRLKRVN